MTPKRRTSSISQSDISDPRSDLGSSVEAIIRFTSIAFWTLKKMSAALCSAAFVLQPVEMRDHGYKGSDFANLANMIDEGPMRSPGTRIESFPYFIKHASEDVASLPSKCLAPAKKLPRQRNVKAEAGGR